MKPIAKPSLDANSKSGSAPDLAQAIDLLWARFLPEIRSRVEVLKAAAAACAVKRLTSAQREAAHAAAHKLAGTLGTFNLTRGTVLAREFELVCCREDTPDATVAGRLGAIAAELRTIVDGRK